MSRSWQQPLRALSGLSGLAGLLAPPSDAERTAASVASGIGVGRLVIGGGLLVAPTAAVRALGVDSASAKRMAFLARMAAVRDVGLGVGTLATRGTPQVALWLGVGAVADGLDAVVVAAARRQGVTRGLASAATVVGAVAAAAAGGWAAGTLRSRRG